MKYGSVCSGIEAASVAWHDLGWEPQWFSEIEQFPSEVLKHRFPDVPNLGDMTQLTQNPTFNERSIDLLVGGTPCQSFSVAGLRKGLADPRGNLMLTFLALADAKKPKWIVWENVPGVLSSNGGRDFACFLDSLEELGYICDVEILDAQFFGVAQRRRRVFVCGQSVDSILNQKTTLSGLTIAQCLTEILHAIWIDALCLLGQEPKNLDQASLSRDGVQRRMRLFGILTENCSYEMWRQLLIEVFQKSVPVQKYWDLPNGAKTEKELTLEDLLMGSSTEGQYILTEESLNKSLEDLYDLMKLYTTLTLTKETIQPKISMFFRIGEVIGRLILRLSGSSPNSLSATSSFLTLSQNLTNYARQTSRDIFSEMGGICEITNIIKQANNRDATFGYLGDWRVAAAVLFERESLQGNTKPSRKKREEVASDVEGSVGEAGDVSCVGGNLSPTVTSKWKTGYGGPSGSNETGNMVYAPTIIDQSEGKWISPNGEETIGTIMARDYKGLGNQDLEDGRGLAIRPHAVAQPIAVDTYNYTTNDHTTQTIRSQSDTEHIGAVLQPIAVDVYNQSIDGQTSATITEAVGGTNTSGPKVMHSMAIRRLTPKECERLQGFPDDWTKIPYRNKDADQCPDGPRYKACGNSMAVPVMRWIGQRIQLIEKIINE